MAEIINNPTIRAILERQSIRSYKPNQITEDELKTLMAAALRAPSGRNGQPCNVRFVQNSEMLHQMHLDFKDLVGWDTPAYTRSDTNPFYHNAPTFVMIFAEDKSDINAGIMIENICVAAKSLSIGSCIVASVGSLMNHERGNKWKKELNIPESYVYLIGACIGYPDEKPEPKPRDENKIQRIK